MTVVETYKSIFFDVGGRLDAGDTIVRDLILPPANGTTWSRATAAKMLGLSPVGTSVLDEFLHGGRRRRRSRRHEVVEFLTTTARDLLNLKRLVVHSADPRNSCGGINTEAEIAGNGEEEAALAGRYESMRAGVPRMFPASATRQRNKSAHLRGPVSLQCTGRLNCSIPAAAPWYGRLAGDGSAH